MQSQHLTPTHSNEIMTVLSSRGQSLEPDVRDDMEMCIGHSISSLDLGSAVGSAHRLKVASSDDPLEREADSMARKAVSQRASGKRHDFRDVRIHVDERAGRSARNLGARAYALGNHIVFAEGQYQPHTPQGRLLLAHELVHVLQQRHGNRFLIQRAEVADTALPSGIKLDDLKTELNKKVNDAISKARAAAAGVKDKKKKGFKVAQEVFNRIGQVDKTRPWLAQIEVWTNQLKKAKAGIKGLIFLPTTSNSRYANLSVWTPGLTKTQRGVWAVGGLAPVANVNGILVGTDKIGHMFQLGFYYFAKKHPEITMWEEKKYGDDKSEFTDFGLDTTGVYSNADLAANHKGLKFYDDLLANPAMTFDITKYIAKDWNEAINPNYYTTAVATAVWKKVLSRNWSGHFTVTGAAGSTSILTTLTVAGTSVTGDYVFYNSKGNKLVGKITSGTITYHKSASHKSAVTHVEINFQWTQGGLSGKGTWISANEMALNGTWGNGASAVNGGKWNLQR